MVKEDILTGLTNGVLRGESIERAMNTMILAGYNVQDVQEASKYIHIDSKTQSQANQAITNQKTPDVKELPKQNPPIQQTQPQNTSSKKKIIIIIGSIILFILLAIVAAFILYGEQILKLLFGQ